MNGFLDTLIAGASLAAIITALWSVRRWRNDRKIERELSMHLGRLLRVNLWLTVVAIELDQKLSAGIGWRGKKTNDMNNPITGHLWYCDGIAVELEHSTAELRAMDANGAIERLREDLERLTAVLREAADMYQEDTWSRYLEIKGEPIGYSDDGDEPTVALEACHVPRVEELRREATLLLRTSMRRLNKNDYQTSYEVTWPVKIRPSSNVDTNPLWGGQPRPMSTGK
jgi:hypothetical protein